MTNAILLGNFFKQVFERHINEDMLERNYVFPTEKVTQYVYSLCAIPYCEFLDYLREQNEFVAIEAKDVTQNSSIEDCHINLCKALLRADDPGMDYNAVGRALQDDGVVRKPGADKKYGENHVKTAFQLGLAWELCGTWYLTCIGRVFCDLPHDIQLAIMSRCMLRSPFYARLVCDATDRFVHLYNYMSFLSPSTIRRRMPSVKKMLQIIIRANTDWGALRFRLETAIRESNNLVPIADVDTDQLLAVQSVADDSQP